MIEVFKTDVRLAQQADMLAYEILQHFTCYKVNFDLDDCDRILRVEYTDGFVDEVKVIEILNFFGFNAEVLVDDFMPKEGLLMK